MKLRRLLIMLVAAIAALPAVMAQEAPYRFDIGASVGMSGYLGDVNESNLMKRPGVVGALQFRYILNSRFAFRTQFDAMTLRGNSADFKYEFPGGKHYSFSSAVFDLGERVEFNFFPYGIGETYKRLRRWTPFVAAGVGVTMSSIKHDGAFVAFSVPLTAGVRYKMHERWNLALEFTMTKVFGDHVDGNIADLYGIKSSFIKNTDWYSGLMLSITYEFGKRCETCNRID